MINGYKSYVLLHISCVALVALFFGSCKKKNTPSQTGGAVADSAFTSYFQRTTGWIAGDGAYSIPLASGRSLWVFGDSHIYDFDPFTRTTPCLFQVNNACLLMDINNPTGASTLTGTGPRPSCFQVGSSNNYWFWSGCGYQQGDSVYEFLQRIHSTGTGGSFGFEGVDSNYVATMPASDLSQIRYSLLPSKNGIIFTNALVKEADGTCYIYGIKSNGFGNDLFAAKFNATDPRGQWQYYNSTGWTDNVNSITKIYDDFTASFYVCKIKNKYVLITTEFSVGCDQGKNIYVATSDNPFGPFVNKHSVWQVPERLEGHSPMFYLANAHPEFDNGKNELLITYCINGYGDCVNTCVNNRTDPDTYRPKAIRVPYKTIDASLE